MTESVLVESTQNPIFKYRNHNLPRLYLATLFLRSAFGVVTLVLPIYLKELTESGRQSFSGLQIGLIVAAIFMSEITLITIFGRLSDLLQQRKTFIITGNFIAAIALAMFSFLNHFWAFFIAHIVEGIGAAMAIGPSLALVADSSSHEDHGEKMGLFETVTFGGMALGFLFGGIMYDNILGGIHGNGRMTFFFASFFLLAGGILATTIKEDQIFDPDQNRHTTARFYRELIPHKPLLTYAASMIALITILSGVSLSIQNRFTIIGAILGKGIELPIVGIFYGSAIIMLVLGLIDLYFELTHSAEDKRPLAGHDQGHVEQVLKLIRNSDLSRILPAWLFVMIILGTIVTFLPIILSTGITQPGQGDVLSADEGLSAGLSSAQVGIYLVSGMTVLGVMQVFFGKLVDRIGRRPILLLGVVSLVLLSAEIVFVVSFHPEWFVNPFAGNGLIFVITASMIGLGVSGFGPAALTVLADNTSYENRGTTAGIYSLLLGLGHIIGDLFGGVLWDLGNNINGSRGGAVAIFGFVFILAIAAFISVYFIKPHEKVMEEQPVKPL